jgi:hypothetical protein
MRPIRIRIERVLPIVLLMGCTLSIFTVSALSQVAIPGSREITLRVGDAFTPTGLTSATDAYVTVSGIFSNTCYRWDRAEVTNSTPLIHEIKCIADVGQHTMCAMHIVPYQKRIELGRLATGTHTLRFLNGDGTYFEKTLTIE